MLHLQLLGELLKGVVLALGGARLLLCGKPRYTLPKSERNLPFGPRPQQLQRSRPTRSSTPAGGCSRLKPSGVKKLCQLYQGPFKHGGIQTVLALVGDH